MRTVVLLGTLLFVLMACNKKLPPEEQKRLQEKAKERVIQRVTNEQILELVQTKTTSLDQLLSTESKSDSVFETVQSKIGDQHLIDFSLTEEISTGKLREIMEAYMYSIAEGNTVGTNLQELESGNFLYSIPNVYDSAGITVLKGVWQIEFQKKYLVKEITDQY